MKKIVLVTSTITYIPDDYISVLKKVIGKNKENISAIILIKINRINLIKKIILLFIVGAPRLAGVLLKNLIKDIFNLKYRYLKSRDLEVIKIKNINDERILNFIKDEKINFIFNMRSRSIFKKEVIQSVDEILNIHHGILPINRGVFSDMRNLANGGELGFSIHKINEKIDDGNILEIKKIKYKKDKKYLDYLEFSSREEGDFLSSFILNYENKKGVKNNSKNFILYKNPTWKEMKKMRKKGLMI